VLSGGPADLVHVHCGEDLAVLPLAWLAARRRGCPLVATVHLSVRHALRPVTARGVMLRAAGGVVEGLLLPAADAVIALSASTARLLRGDGILAGRVRVIPPGYDPALFAKAAADDPFPGLPRPRVTYLGRLVPQKDVGTLLQAFARLPAGTQLLVVGDGPDRAALQRRAQRFGGRVHFTGFVPHVQVPAVLRHADLLVLPSRFEDLSSALIEAMAAGLPVVATRVGGTADLVRHGVNGLLVAPCDPAALAAAIGQILADPAAAARMSAAARRTAAGYAWPDLARQVLEVYQQVTERQAPGLPDTAAPS
jgi:glycogen(starch) synthase